MYCNYNGLITPKHVVHLQKHQGKSNALMACSSQFSNQHNEMLLNSSISLCMSRRQELSLNLPERYLKVFFFIMRKLRPREAKGLV